MHPLRQLPLAAALLCGTFAASAFAQGTTEQREACTPDAVRLCSDTIPDVGKTTACMRRHEAELSPRCHAAFLGGPSPRKRMARGEATRTARAPAPAGDDVAGLPQVDVPQVEAPDVDVPDIDTRVDRRDVRRARRVITRLCREDTLDSSTCRLAGVALDLAR